MWYYRHSFSRRFDDDRNLNASFSKSQNFISFHCIDHTNTCEGSIKYTDGFKITSRFLLDDLPLIKRVRLKTKSKEHSPFQKPKCKAKQLLDFLTAFQEKLNE